MANRWSEAVFLNLYCRYRKVSARWDGTSNRLESFTVNLTFQIIYRRLLQTADLVIELHPSSQNYNFSVFA